MVYESMMKLSIEKLHSLQKAYERRDSTTVGLATTNCEIKSRYLHWDGFFETQKDQQPLTVVIHVKHVHGAFSTTDGADVRRKGAMEKASASH
ncbi:hypothetical protein Bca101_052915 [Brassica carinata]